MNENYQKIIKKSKNPIIQKKTIIPKKLNKPKKSNNPNKPKEPNNPNKFNNPKELNNTQKPNVNNTTKTDICMTSLVIGVHQPRAKLTTYIQLSNNHFLQKDSYLNAKQDFNLISYSFSSGLHTNNFILESYQDSGNTEIISFIQRKGEIGYSKGQSFFIFFSVD